MIDRDAARLAVEGWLSEMPPVSADDAWVILDEHTIERDWGWVFFWDSKLHHETGDFRYTVAGNAPFIVRRRDGTILETGTAHPIEDFVRQFQASGQLP